MPSLTQEKIIKGYWEEVKDQYPNLTFEQFSEICETPAKFTTSQIANGKLPRIHVKYLGDFKVYPKRIAKKLEDIEAWLKLGYITKEKYEERKAFFLNYQEEIRKLERDKTETEPNIEIIDDITNDTKTKD